MDPRVGPRQKSSDCGVQVTSERYAVRRQGERERERESVCVCVLARPLPRL